MESEANVLLPFKPRDSFVTEEAVFHIFMPSK